MAEPQDLTSHGLDDKWRINSKPAQLLRRWEFAAYSDTRTFLDYLAEVSGRTSVYPDLNFGRMHVSATIAAAGTELSEAEYEFARQASTGPGAA